jgi:hypothetical protein
MSTSTRSSASMPPSPGLRTTDPASSTSRAGGSHRAEIRGVGTPALARQRRLAPWTGSPVRGWALCHPGWPGPPAAPGPALPRAARNAPLAGAVSLLLNSGRLRDQWHTMTRTGHVPRLQEAEPWPRVRMGAASLLALGVKEGIWCAFATGSGRRCCWWGWMRGSGRRPSCPCTGPTASAARGRSTASSPPWWIPFRPADVQTGAGAGQGAAHPLARALVWPW